MMRENLSVPLVALRSLAVTIFTTTKKNIRRRLNALFVKRSLGDWLSIWKNVLDPEQRRSNRKISEEAITQRRGR